MQRDTWILAAGLRAGLSFLACAASTSAQGTLWVVDDSGGAGVDFTDIQPAVDAAADGDGILIHAGTYGRFTIDAKALELIGEDGAVVSVDANVAPWSPVVTIANLGPGQRVLWQNLDVIHQLGAFSFADGIPLALESNQGSIWIEGSNFRGRKPPSSNPPGTIRVNQCAAVVLVRCTAEDTFVAPILLGSGGPGLQVVSSDVSAFESTFVGGVGHGGSSFSCTGGTPGAPGVQVTDGSFSAFGCSFEGGPGGPGEELDVFITGAGTDGGAGVALTSASANFAYQDSTFAAGAGGSAINNCPGSPGPPIAPGPGSVTTVAGKLRSLSSTTPVREGDLAAFTFRGEDGDLVFLNLALTPFYLPLPGIVGPLLTGFPATSLFIGTLGPTEELVLPLSVLPMAPALDFRTFYLQSGSLSTALELSLGAPTAWVVLDAGF